MSPHQFFLGHPAFHVTLAATIVASMVAFFSDATILLFIIVFGQVHFLLAYFYANKSGKINRSYGIRFFWVFLLAAVLAILVFRNAGYFPWLILVTGAIFTAHYTTDEIHLFSLQNVLHRVVGVLGMTLTWSAVFVERLFAQTVFLTVLLSVFGVSLILFFLWRNRRVLTRSFRGGFFAVWYILHGLFSVSAALVFDTLSINQILGFIVLTHYVHWYLFSTIRYGGSELSFYVDTILWGHALAFLMFVLYALAPHSGVLFLFFHPAFFYGWTIVHILMTFRSNDLIKQTL